MPRPCAGAATKKKPSKIVAPLAEDQVAEAVTRLAAPAGTDRYVAGKSLIATAEQFPIRVYGHFAALVALLDSPSKIVRWNAIRILSLLAPVDAEGRLDRLLERYLAPIQEPTMITAANTIQGAARIARAKPHLLERILPTMLAVQLATYETPECRNVAIAHVLDAIKSLWPSIRHDPQVLAFVQHQTTNPRGSAAKRARALLS